MEGVRDSLILTQIGEVGFLTPTGNHDREGGYPNPHEYMMKVGIPSFSRNLDIGSFLNWIYEVDKFFDMAYVPMEKQVKFVAYKLKGGAAAWCNQLQVSQRRQRKQPVMRWRRMRQLLQGKLFLPDCQ